MKFLRLIEQLNKGNNSYYILRKNVYRKMYRFIFYVSLYVYYMSYLVNTHARKKMKDLRKYRIEQ